MNEKRKNSLGVSSIAHSLGFNGYDQKAIDAHITNILVDDALAPRVKYMLSIDLLAREFQFDLNPSYDKRMNAKIMAEFEQVSERDEMIRFLKLFVNCTYHLDWVC